MRILLLVLGVVLISGCSTYPKGCDGVMGNTQYLPHDSNIESYKAIAEEVYLYAQMSQNSYMEEDEFSLPKNIKLSETVDDGWGFQANIYEIYKTEAKEDIQEVVISYRGTESFSDWMWGNIFAKQYDLADELYARLYEKYAPIKIVTTGHSLGGGLALHTSVVEKGVDSFVFNPSYRIHRDGLEKKNRRVVIAETGDVLKPLRWILKNPSNHYLGGYYCTKTNNHSMYLLARCLTHVAAIRNNVAVLDSLKVNPSRQCGDTNAVVGGI